MFEAIKKTFGSKIGADIVPDFSGKSNIPAVGESPFKSQQPTPLGQPTAQPRFPNLAQAMQPQYPDATMTSATAEKVLPGVYKDTAGGSDYQLVDQSPTIDISPEQPSFRQKLTDMHQSIVNPEQITAGLQQASDAVNNFKTYAQQKETGIIRPEAQQFVNAPIDLLQGAIKTLQGIDQGTTRMAQSATNILFPQGGAPRPTPTGADIGNLALGGLQTYFNSFMPGTSTVFGALGENPVIKKGLDRFEGAGNKFVVDLTNYIPGVNQIPAEQRSETFSIVKNILVSLLFKKAFDYFKPTSTSLVPTEGAVDMAKYKEASDTLNLKPGEDLNKAFQAKAMETHPDRPGGSNEAFQKVNDAYQYLKQQGFVEARQQVTPEQKTRLGTMIKKVTDKIMAPKKGNIDLSALTTETGEPIKAPKGEEPIYLDEYGNLTKEGLKNIEDNKTKEEALPGSALEMMRTPEYQAKMAKANEKLNEKVTKTSNNLYHTTSAENLESIRRDGLVTGKPARFEGTSSPTKISFGANEATASYYGKPGDVMIRTKTSYKPENLEADLLAGGKGAYTTTKNIPPEMLEVKVKGKWIPLVQDTVKTQPKIPLTTEGKKVPQETVDRLVDKYKGMVSDSVKNNISKRLKGKVLDSVIKKLIQSASYKPKLRDIKEAYKDPRIIYEAMKLASDRQVLDKAELEVMNDIIENSIKQYNKNVKVVNEKSHLDQSQKAVLLKWEDYKTPVKGVEDIKIKIDPINTFLKANPGEKIHIIETPRDNDIKPFAMMGTKENTYPMIMKPNVMRAIEQGKNTYIEPYGGVGTVLYHLPDYFNKGLKEAHLNFFDIEKFTIIKAMKDGKMNINNDITNAYDTIIGDITDALMKNETFKKIYSDAQMGDFAESKVGSKAFKEALTLLGFHPELAKDFFRQNLDVKLSKDGELTQKFKDRVGETIVKPQLREKFPELEGIELEDAIIQGVADVLAKPELFEKQYSGISKSINEVLGKYDTDNFVNSINGDHNKALLVAISKHFRQRGVSGQKIVSPSEGFTSVEGVKDRMIDSLARYKDTLDRFGDKISIYNEDGQKFINDRSHEQRAKDNINNTARYFDPPYMHSNEMYIHNNPGLKDALKNYSDYEGIKDIFRPAISDKNTLLFTNDVDGKYFQSLKDLMGDRMSKDIYAYKEGLTPTSFITTTDVGRGMKDNQFMYYMLNKNAKIMEAVQFIDQLGGDIAQGLKKNITKILSYVSPEMQKSLNKLEEIRSGMVKAKDIYDDLMKGLDLVTTGREKQQLIREAKDLAKKGQLTGKPLIKLIDTIGRNLINLNAEQKVLRGKIDKFKDSMGADVQIKKQFFDAFRKEYTEKKLTQEQQKESDIKSIYSLNIDEVNSLNETFKMYSELARETRIQTIEQKQEEFQKDKDSIIQNLESGKAKPLEKRPSDVSNFITGIWKAILNWIDQYMTYGDRMFNNLGWGKIKKQLDETEYKKFVKEKEIFDPIIKAIKKGNLSRNDLIKVQNYGYTMRGDSMGKVKLFARLTKIGDPEAPKTRKEKLSAKFGKNKPLTEEQAKAKLLEYEDPNYLNDKQKALYSLIRKQLDEIYTLGAKVHLEQNNKIVKYVENFWPIVGDRKQNVGMNFKEEDFDIRELQDSFRGNGISQTLDKKTTATETVPLKDAYSNFAQYAHTTIHYSYMQNLLNKLVKLTNELGENGTKQLGERGYKYFADKDNGYIVNLKRAGRLDLTKYEQFLEQLTTNFARSATLLSPTSLVVQSSNVFDVMLSQHTGPIFDVLKKILGDPLYFKKVIDRSPFLQQRIGNDKIKVIQDGLMEQFSGKMKKLEDWSAKLLNIPDMITAISINEGYYNKFIKQGLSHDEAQYKADQWTKEGVGTFNYLDLPQSTRVFKGYLSAVRMFQGFVMNRWNNMRYKSLGQERTTYAGKTATILFSIAVLIGATIYEQEIRNKMNKVLYGTKDKGIKPSVIVPQLITNTIPYLGNIVQTDQFGQLSLNPQFASLSSFATLANDIKKIVTGKHVKGSKVMGDFTIAVGAMMGIPGTMTAGRLIKKSGQ